MITLLEAPDVACQAIFRLFLLCYDLDMQKTEFVEITGNVLKNPPQRTVRTEVSFFFGLFRKSEHKSITLPKDIIRDYATYIVRNFKGFSEPEDIKILYQTEPEDFALYSLTSREEDLEDVIEKAKNEETFSDMLIRLQRERNLKAPDLYHAAGIDYKHFSKIISDRSYKTSKATVFAFAIALHLDLNKTEELLKKAGHAINPSDMFDMTIKYFIQTRCYDRTKIDMLMETFELPLLPQNW